MRGVSRKNDNGFEVGRDDGLNPLKDDLRDAQQILYAVPNRILPKFAFPSMEDGLSNTSDIAAVRVAIEKRVKEVSYSRLAWYRRGSEGSRGIAPAPFLFQKSANMPPELGGGTVTWYCYSHHQETD